MHPRAARIRDRFEIDSRFLLSRSRAARGTVFLIVILFIRHFFRTTLLAAERLRQIKYDASDIGCSRQSAEFDARAVNALKRRELFIRASIFRLLIITG